MQKGAIQDAIYSRRDILGMVRMEITARHKLDLSVKLGGSRNDKGYKNLARQHAKELKIIAAQTGPRPRSR